MRGPLLLCALALGCTQKAEPPKRSTPAPAPKAAAEPTREAPAPDAGAARTLAEATAEQAAGLEQGNKALAEGDQAGALAAFLAASEGPASGASVSAGLAAGDLLEQLGRGPEAGALYRRLADGAPHLPEIHFVRGRFLAGQGDKMAAIGAFERAVALQPDLLPIYPLLGALQHQIGQRDAAGQTLAQYEVRLQKQLKTLRDRAQPPGERLVVVDLLATLDDERVSRALIATLKDPVKELRLAAADALAADPRPENLVAISEAALAEPDPVARRVMTAILGRARREARQP